MLSSLPSYFHPEPFSIGSDTFVYVPAPKPNNKFPYLKLHELLSYLGESESVLVPYDRVTSTNVNKIQHATGKPFKAVQLRYNNLLKITQTNESFDSTARKFVYFSTKLKEFPPRELFIQGKSLIEVLLTKRKLVRVYDFPLIPYGFYHNDIFLPSGELNLGEFSRLETLFCSITGKQLK